MTLVTTCGHLHGHVPRSATSGHGMCVSSMLHVAHTSLQSSRLRGSFQQSVSLPCLHILTCAQGSLAFSFGHSQGLIVALLFGFHVCFPVTNEAEYLSIFLLTTCCSIFFLIFFSTFIYFWDRERQSMNGGGAEREGDTESETGSRL